MSSSEPIVLKYQETFETLQQEINAADPPRTIAKALRRLQKQSESMINFIAKLTSLVDIAALVTSSLNVDNVLEEVLDTLIQITDAERAYIVLNKESSDGFEFATARTRGKENLDDNEIVYSRLVVETVLEKMEPIVTYNAQLDERFAASESIHAHGLRAIVCAPLVHRERIIGVIYADNPANAGIFPLEMLPLIGAFADQVAIAIENARLFQNTEAELKETKREVQRLRIQINEQQVEQEVGTIVESDYFQRLVQAAEDIKSGIYEKKD